MCASVCLCMCAYMCMHPCNYISIFSTKSLKDKTDCLIHKLCSLCNHFIIQLYNPVISPDHTTEIMVHCGDVREGWMV